MAAKWQAVRGMRGRWRPFLCRRQVVDFTRGGHSACAFWLPKSEGDEDSCGLAQSCLTCLQCREECCCPGAVHVQAKQVFHCGLWLFPNLQCIMRLMLCNAVQLGTVI